MGRPGHGLCKVTLDGQTLPRTISAGESQGLRLLAAFLPEKGWVLMQVEVGDGESEGLENGLQYRRDETLRQP